MSGDKTEDSNGELDIWIVKTDATGNIQWQNTIGGSGSDGLWTIQQTADGGYILGGNSTSPASGDKTEGSNGDYDLWILKTDATGNIQWQNTIGGSGSDGLYAIEQLADEGFMIGGYSDSPLSGDKAENSNGGYDYWILKTDATGNIEWQNTIGGAMDDFLFSMDQTTDGGYILAGSSESSISGDKTENSVGADYWMVKTDGTGNIQWQNTIGGDGYDAPCSVQQTADGGYMLGGYSTSDNTGDKTELSNGGNDYWIVKTDATGNIEWQNTIGGAYDETLNSIMQTADGGYVLGGFSPSPISGDKTEDSNGVDDYWILKCDPNGTIEWENTIKAVGADQLFCVQETSDGGYILGGYSDSPISDDKTEDSNGLIDYWIVKFASDGPSSVAPSPSKRFSVSLAPNPACSQLAVTSSEASITELDVINALGQPVPLPQGSTNERSRTIDVSQLVSGMYSVRVKTRQGIRTLPFVKE